MRLLVTLGSKYLHKSCHFVQKFSIGQLLQRFYAFSQPQLVNLKITQKNVREKQQYAFSQLNRCFSRQKFIPWNANHIGFCVIIFDTPFGPYLDQTSRLTFFHFNLKTVSVLEIVVHAPMLA